MYDGHFQDNDKTIYYTIADDSSEIKMVHGVEKMARWFHFFNENGTVIKVERAYDTTEKLLSITPSYAKKIFYNE